MAIYQAKENQQPKQPKQPTENTHPREDELSPLSEEELGEVVGGQTITVVVDQEYRTK